MEDKLTEELDITCRVYACVTQATKEAFERFSDINPVSTAAQDAFCGWVIGRAEQLRQERRNEPNRVATPKER